MKGLKYVVAVGLLLSLPAVAKMAEKVDIVDVEYQTIDAPSISSCGCECTSPVVELVDECKFVKKHSPDICFKTKSNWECIRTYKVNGADECVRTLNGEVVTNPCCDPCNTCKPSCPKPCCRPCRKRCR